MSSIPLTLLLLYNYPSTAATAAYVVHAHSLARFSPAACLVAYILACLIAGNTIYLSSVASASACDRFFMCGRSVFYPGPSSASLPHYLQLSVSPFLISLSLSYRFLFLSHSHCSSFHSDRYHSLNLSLSLILFPIRSSLCTLMLSFSRARLHYQTSNVLSLLVLFFLFFSLSSIFDWWINHCTNHLDQLTTNKLATNRSTKQSTYQPTEWSINDQPMITFIYPSSPCLLLSSPPSAQLSSVPLAASSSASATDIPSSATTLSSDFRLFIVLSHLVYFSMSLLFFFYTSFFRFFVCLFVSFFLVFCPRHHHQQQLLLFYHFS